MLKEKKTLYEKDELNNRLEEIKNSDIAKEVKAAQSAIAIMNVLVASSMINATSNI